jgi:O-antigen/teichoic acid export membrane protein
MWVFLRFIFSTLTAVSGSVVQGFQLFLWFALLSAGGAIVKLIVSIPFAYNGVEMTMIASFLISVVMYLSYLIPIRFLFRTKPESMNLTKKDLLKFSIPTFFTLLGMTALYSMDIVLAKHYLSSYDAGIYSAVAVLGKVIFYASSAVGTVLFPVLSERFAQGKDTFPIIRLSVILVAGVSIGATAIYFLYSNVVTHLLFGSSFNTASTYLGIFAVFITLYSIANIIVSACLAIEKMQVYLFTCFAAILQILLIGFFHGSLLEIIYINIGIAFMLLIGVGVYYIYGKNKHYYSGL